LPEGKLNVIAEVKSKKIRYLALPSVNLSQGQELEFNPVLKDAGDIDRFCAECHPYKGDPVRSGQIVRDLHPSGMKPKKKMRTTELLDERGWVTCESCHTLHQETGVGRFVHYKFRNGNLCNRCH